MSILEKKFLREELLPATWGTISAHQMVILSIIFENGTTIFKMEQKWDKNGTKMGQTWWKHAIHL